MSEVVLVPCWDPSLICSLSFLPLMFILFTDKESQHQRWREIRSQPQWTLPQGQGLINNLHISKLHRIKSNMPCFLKTTGAGFNWEASHVESEGSCLFFWNNLSFSLSFSSISAPFLSNPPPSSLSLSSLSVWALHTAEVLCYCTPLHACAVWLRAHSQPLVEETIRSPTYCEWK